MDLALISIVMPIGIEFVWIMSGTCRPRNGCRPIATSPAVGGVGWVGEFEKAVRCAMPAKGERGADNYQRRLSWRAVEGGATVAASLTSVGSA